MASVLYPYVYLSARASFVQQSVCALEVARTLGRTPLATFWAVALPLARPALAAGLALVLMECLNDLGAVQYLGVQTLSQSIYSTWLQRSNLGGAAQIASVMLLLIVAMLWAERWARGGAKVHHTTGRYRSIPFQELNGWLGRCRGPCSPSRRSSSGFCCRSCNSPAMPSSTPKRVSRAGSLRRHTIHCFWQPSVRPLRSHWL